MNQTELQRLIEKKSKSGRKIFCSGCGKEVREDENLTSLQYVKTGRGNEFFFHGRCIKGLLSETEKM